MQDYSKPPTVDLLLVNHIVYNVAKKTFRFVVGKCSHDRNHQPDKGATYLWQLAQCRTLLGTAPCSGNKCHFSQAQAGIQSFLPAQKLQMVSGIVVE